MAALETLAALLAIGILYQRVGLWRDGRRVARPGGLIDAAGDHLHVVEQGSGSPAVVLEAGIAGSSLSWAVVQPAIAGFTRVCAYDRAGLGWSGPSSSPMTFDRIVEELGAVVHHLDPRAPVVLVGHSFGSFVVRAYAARHPDRVAGIVLLDPPTEWLTMTPERAHMLWGGRHLSGIGAVLAHVGVVRACLALLTGGAPAAPRGFVRVFGPTAARTLERLVGEVRKLPSDVHPAVQAHWCRPGCFRAMADHIRVLERDGASMAADVPPPEVPVVVLSGGNQPPDQLAAHRALADSSRHGRHVVVERSAHWVQFDTPELVVSTVRALVESSRTAGPGNLAPATS